jgi:hypothetical protein
MGLLDSTCTGPHLGIRAHVLVPLLPVQHLALPRTEVRDGATRAPLHLQRLMLHAVAALRGARPQAQPPRPEALVAEFVPARERSGRTRRVGLALFTTLFCAVRTPIDDSHGYGPLFHALATI